MDIKQVYDTVMTSDELKASFIEAAKSRQTLEKWLKNQGCSASFGEIVQFLQEQKDASAEVDDDELENAAGGKNPTNTVFSAISVGIGCAALAVFSKYDQGDTDKCFLK